VRSLSADEQALWERVAATIRPLSRELKTRSPAPPPDEERPEVRRPEAPHSQPPKRPPPKRVEHRGHATATLDSTWDRRLRSGSISPDRTLDLHGLNLDQAWEAIDRGLERAIVGGDRVLLLVTGHSRSGDPPVQRGKIRAAVHDWLAASRHAPEIAAVRGAHPRHGGGGSLYIILRRKRSGSIIS
jgi:DNA-nicking Smr family endonuclease